MYRYFTIRNITVQNPYKISNVEYLPKTCAFCNLCHRCTTKSFQLRFHSSNTMLSPVKKKKFKRKFRNYAELLEVTNSTTNNTKAAVQKLNAEHVSKLVNQPNITLDKLDKFYYNEDLMNKKKENKSNKDLNNLTIHEDIQNLAANRLKFSKNNVGDYRKLSSLNVLQRNDKSKFPYKTFSKESELSEISYLTDFIHNKMSSNSVEKDHFLKLLNEKSFDSNVEPNKLNLLISEEKSKFSDTIILAYMNVYAYSHNSDCTEKMIQWFNGLKSSGNVYIMNIKVYNILIEKLSFESDIKRILKIFEFLRISKIEPNIQTYTYIFNCIGRLTINDQNKYDIAKRIESEFNSDGFTLNDIITKSVYVRDQRIYAEKVAKILDNQFQPIFSSPDIKYDCTLLQNLHEKETVLPSTVENLVTFSDIEKLFKQQMKLELDGLTTIYNIAKRNSDKGATKILREQVFNLDKKWRKSALDAFERNLSVLQNIESFKSRQMSLYPYLSILKPEDYVDIIMRKAQKIALTSEDYSVAYTALCYDAGFQVYQKYEAQIRNDFGIQDKIMKIYMQYCDWFIKRNDNLNCREKWTALAYEANKKGVSTNYDVPKWPTTVFAAIGRFLLEIIINDLKIDGDLIKKKTSKDYKMPAFFKILRNSGIKMKEQLKPNPIVSQLYKDSDLEYLTFETTLVPLLCPPLPWVSMHQGGYTISKADLIRLDISARQRFEKLIDASPKKLYPALDSLNQLGSVPWTINSKILDIAIEVFQNNGSVTFHIPQPPSVLGPLPHLPKNGDGAEKRKIFKDRFDLNRRKKEMYSMWCDTLYRLSLANHFRDKIFWLPHNMDFRGRVYPIPPHLNHLGSDLSRSLLVFALKKPLGPKGLDWLKVHAINLTGLKKGDSIKNRLIYANEILDKMLDSAEKPLTGELWWTTSDDPWQTLATCMEISAALKSPNLEEFISGFPIHQDGSCNGLQHYAALGRDKIGALSVNLDPSEVPQDVYSTVATIVEEKRKQDVKNDIKIAKLLDGCVKRKVIKQTVMTTVYGVTLFGAKLQILRQLKDINQLPEEFLWTASTYLTNKTFEALATMFKSAKEIQDWFSQCSYIISKVRQENMEWITPLGFPVVQPYASHLQLPKHKLDTRTMYSDFKLKPDSRKQKNAFAPNFIHSLDSTHMMLTSLYCELAGITFVSVHDCFWTHPCNVQIMNKVCREQFVSLHSQPILQDLSKFFFENFGFVQSLKTVNSKKCSRKDAQLQEKLNSVLLKVPNQGDFDISKVLTSTYFFS